MLLSAQMAPALAPARLRPLTILVLCTGNSARSIMAQALLQDLGSPWIRAFSAGSRPTGRVHPYALEQIRAHLDQDGSAYRSKGWEQFAESVSQQPIDIVLTVCANAAREPCPLFPGAALRVHWDFSDPAAALGDENAVRAAFAATFAEMRMRVRSLVQRPLAHMDAQQMAEALQALSA